MRFQRSLTSLGLAAVSAMAFSQTNLGALQRLSDSYAWDWAVNQGRIQAYSQWTGDPLRVESGAGVLQLVGFANGKPLFYATTGLEACDTVSADEVWAGGTAGLSLSGAGVTIGIWDEGAVQANHPELNGRVTQQDGAVGGGSHATPVAGVMIAAGVDAQAKGFAFSGSLDAFDFNSDLSEMATAAAGGLRISNHSYGYAGGWFNDFRGDGLWTWLGDVDISPAEEYKFGFYGTTAAALDNIAFNAKNYLICQAVGNERGNGPATQPVNHWIFSNTLGWVQSSDVRQADGGTGGYDTLMEQATAKNVLSVGAADQILGGYANAAGVRVLSTSSFGPTDDGRIKPDLVACGGNVYSSALGGGYTTIGGTSMATPNVAGTAGLLLQHYRSTHGNQSPTAATLKALMIHGADECGDSEGPDYRYGYGLLNAKTSAGVITEDVVRTNTITESTLTNGLTTNVVVSSDGTEPLKVTLVWTDPAGTANPASLNTTTPKLVNDLDLRIGSSITTLRPWKLDPTNPSAAATSGINSVDNVEQIEITNPTPGIYSIIINHKGASLLPAGSQPFSLIITGQSKVNLASLQVTPTTVIAGASMTGTVNLDVPAPAGGRTVHLSANVTAISTPASVNVPAGDTQATFPITTSGVTVNTPGIVQAQMNGITRISNVTINRANLSTLSITPTKINGGATATGTVTLDGLAPTGGSNVIITSNKPQIASADSPVKVPSGTNTVNFAITTVPIAVPSTVTFTATRAGITRTANLIVRAGILSSIQLTPKIVAGSQSSVGRAVLTSAAPTGGALVTLSESSPFVTIPASVLIPEGATSATFDIQTTAVTSNQEVQIVGQLRSVQRANILSVYPTTLSALDMTPTNVVGGTSSTGTVTLSLPAPTGGANVVLTSANPAVASMVNFVTVGANQTTKSFTIFTSPVVVSTNVQLIASRNGITKTRVLTVRP